MENNSLYTTMLRAGKTTYFVDLKTAKNGNKYLSICESQITGDSKEKITIRIFGETMTEFQKAVNDAVAAVTP